MSLTIWSPVISVAGHKQRQLKLHLPFAKSKSPCGDFLRKDKPKMAQGTHIHVGNFASRP